MSNLDLPWHKLEDISSSVATCVGEEAAPHLATASFQVVIESIKVFPEPSLLQENCTMVLMGALHHIFISSYHPLFSLAQRLR